MHRHLLNPNTQFGAEHIFHPHIGTKLNILNLSWESRVERIGENKMDRSTDSKEERRYT